MKSILACSGDINSSFTDSTRVAEDTTDQDSRCISTTRHEETRPNSRPFLHPACALYPAIYQPISRSALPPCARFPLCEVENVHKPSLGINENMRREWGDEDVNVDCSRVLKKTGLRRFRCPLSRHVRAGKTTAPTTRTAEGRNRELHNKQTPPVSVCVFQKSRSG